MAKEYIDKKAVLDKIDDALERTWERGAEYQGLCKAHDIIHRLPAADVVEVVRCKNCAHYHQMDGYDYKEKPLMYCVWHSRYSSPEGYCDEGIKRDQNNENAKN